MTDIADFEQPFLRQYDVLTPGFPDVKTRREQHSEAYETMRAAFQTPGHNRDEVIGLYQHRLIEIEGTEMNTNELLDRIPAHCRGGLLDYINHHIPTGRFLYAVLSNDLRDAYGRADDINRAHILDYVTYLWNCAPDACWGSPERVDAWLKAGHRSCENEQ